MSVFAHGQIWTKKVGIVLLTEQAFCDIIISMKTYAKQTCPGCGCEFMPRGYKKQTFCTKNCQSRDWVKRNPEKAKELGTHYKKNHPDRVKVNQRKAALKRRFGITLEQYNKMLEEQGGVCAICRIKKNETLAVGHDHKTGKIRGLLCGHCNHVVGFAKDNIELLERTIKYLDK